MSPLRVAIYGLGRAGLSLAASLHGAGCAPALLYNRDASRAEQARARLRLEVHSGSPPPPGDVDLAIIAVSDRHIGELVDALLAAGPLAPGVVLAHLSGALGPALLDRGQKRAWHVGAIHPLRSLLGADSRWQGALCGLGGEPAALTCLQDLADLLGCPWAIIDDELRPLYHAAASLAANDLLALLDASARAFEKAGLTAQQALRCASDLSQTVFANAARLGPAAALTGPLRRGEVQVLRAQDRALQKHSTRSRELHRTCSRYLLKLLHDAGADTEHRAAVEAMLSEPLTGA